MNTKFLTLFLLMLGVASLGLSSAYAYQGDPNVEGPNYTSQRHEAMTEAFENKDFNAWKEARGDMKNGRMMEVVSNEENFAKFVEMRELRLAGDIEGVNAIRAELGLGQGQGRNGNVKKGGQGNYNRMKDNSQRGQNSGGRYVDADGDGQCDYLNK